ncbi:MAG: DNA-binding protein [Ruminococcus sp.]|nr:DNA-binding protein [Ruminococcus sp.]MDE6834732.1 DNA-binding protein [Ruminococcus sp.]
MSDKSFMRVEDVARELDVSKSYAYKIVQQLNKELAEKGYLTISGRINRKYFLERTCYDDISGKNERND